MRLGEQWRGEKYQSEGKRICGEEKNRSGEYRREREAQQNEGSRK